MYLNCKTYFSFKYGTFSTEDLVKTAVDKGVTALALTNTQPMIPGNLSDYAGSME